MAVGVTDATYPTPSSPGAHGFKSFPPPLGWCAWPGPTSPPTLTSELSYKYALSILVTFPKKYFQVINTQASATQPALPPSWLGAGGSDRLENGEGNRSRATYSPK